MAFLEPFDVFFSPAGFGQPVQIGDYGTEITINAIFNNDHVDLPGKPEVSVSGPQITCKTSDVANIEEYARVVVGTVVYKVYDIQQDGTGVTVLILKRSEDL